VHDHRFTLSAKSDIKLNTVALTCTRNQSGEAVFTD
jgi:hypothetical protein